MKLTLLILTVLLAACAPSLDTPDQITNAFILTADGRTFRPENGRINYEGDAYSLSFQLSEGSIRYRLRNTTGSPLTIGYGTSALVPPASDTRVAIPATERPVAARGAPPVVVRPDAQTVETILPLEAPRFSTYGMSINRFMNFPGAKPVTFRLLLALTVNGTPQTEALTFTTAPR